MFSITGGFIGGGARGRNGSPCANVFELNFGTLFVVGFLTTMVMVGCIIICTECKRKCQLSGENTTSTNSTNQNIDQQEASNVNRLQSKKHIQMKPIELVSQKNIYQVPAICRKM